MLRNKQEEKLKYLRRLDKYQDALEPRRVDYIPVEKPFFVGWNIHITLSESGMRRRDAPDLIAVLNILGATKKQFSRSVKFIKYLRSFRYSVELTAGQYKYKNYRWTNNHNFPYWYKDRLAAYYIDERQYEQVPLHLRRYFCVDDDSEYKKYVRHKVYRLSFMNGFPLYELVYKVEKAYANALGIPRGSDISEDERIRKILQNNFYWKDGYRYAYNDHRINVIDRRAWKQFCQNMKHSDLSYEAEAECVKHLKNQKYR